MVATAKCEHVLQEVLMLHFKSLLALLFRSLSKLRHLSCTCFLSLVGINPHLESSGVVVFFPRKFMKRALRGRN